MTPYFSTHPITMYSAHFRLSHVSIMAMNAPRKGIMGATRLTRMIFSSLTTRNPMYFFAMRDMRSGTLILDTTKYRVNTPTSSATIATPSRTSANSHVGLAPKPRTMNSSGRVGKNRASIRKSRNTHRTIPGSPMPENSPNSHSLSPMAGPLRPCPLRQFVRLDVESGAPLAGVLQRRAVRGLADLRRRVERPLHGDGAPIDVVE